MSAKPRKPRRGAFPWEYDGLAESERQAYNLRGRRRKKALSKVEAQKQRARRVREQADRPLDAGMPKIIRVWPQGWRVPVPTQPMTAKEYAAYGQTDHWQDFRRRYREAGHSQECYVCGAAEYELHHHTYARLGREEFADVVPLCNVHHRAVHKAVKAGVKLANAHTYIKTRFQRNELGVRKRTLTSE